MFINPALVEPFGLTLIEVCEFYMLKALDVHSEKKRREDQYLFIFVKIL